MIRFFDSYNNSQQLESPDFKLNDNEIGSSVGSEYPSAKRFWDELFSKTICSSEISIEQEVYGRDEDEFEFDFSLTDSELHFILQRFSQNEWDSICIEEQKCTINALARLIGGE